MENPLKDGQQQNFLLEIFFEQDGLFKSWENFNRIHDLGSEKMFKWRQARHAIPESWKRIIRTNLETFNLSNGNMRTQHALYNASDYILEKCTSKMFYGKLIKNKIEKPTAQKKIEEKLPGQTLDWAKIYSYARQTTLDSFSRIFYYKLVNNILYLNASLTHMGLSNQPLCSYCNLENEVPIHLFYECPNTQRLWTELQNALINMAPLPNLSRKNALTGLPHESLTIAKHIHLIFIMTIYKRIKEGSCSLVVIKNKIKYIKRIESNMCFNNVKQRNINALKWARIHLT
jgi:hypothetical protein